MSQSGRNSKRAGNRVNKGRDLDLAQIVVMLRLLGCMTGALFVVALLFFVLLPVTEEGSVIYPLVLVINMITSAGSLIGSRLLDKKDKELTQREEQAALDRARVVKGKKKDKDTADDSKNQ